MKTYKLFAMILSLLVGMSTFAAKVDDSEFTIGRPSAAEKSLEFNTGSKSNNAKIKGSAAEVKIITEKVRIGKGTAGDKSIVFDNGSPNLPGIRYNEDRKTIETSNNGQDYKPIGTGTGAGSEKNFITNPSAEFNYTDGWTATNLTVGRDTSAGNRIDGTSSFRLSSNVDGATFCTDALTLDDNVTGQCEFAEEYKGDGNWRTVLYNGSAPVATIDDNLAISQFTPIWNWAGCASGYKLCKVHKGTNLDSINVGKFYWGKAKHTVVGTGSQFVGSITWQPTSGCTWTKDLGFANLSNANCGNNPRLLRGSLTDPSNGLRPAIGLSTQKGRYLVKIKGEVGASGSSGTSSAIVRLFTGTEQLGNSQYTGISTTNGGAGDYKGSLEFEFTETGSRNLTIDFQGQESTGSATFSTSVINYPFEISVYFYPSGVTDSLRSQHQIRRDMEIYDVLGDCDPNTIATNNKVIGRTSGDYSGDSYYDVYAKLWALPGLCANNVPSGCSAWTRGLKLSGATAKASTALADWNAGRTITIDLRDVFLRGIGDLNGLLGGFQFDAFQGHWHQANYDETGLTAGTYRMGRDGGSNPNSINLVKSPISDGTNGTPRTAPETRPMNIGVNYCLNFRTVTPQPVIPGQVGTQTVTGSTWETGRISSTGQIINGSDWIASVYHPSTGIYDVTVRGFSTIPNCIPQEASGAGNRHECKPLYNGTESATLVQIRCQDSAGAVADDPFILNCSKGK